MSAITLPAAVVHQVTGLVLLRRTEVRLHRPAFTQSGDLAQYSRGCSVQAEMVPVVLERLLEGRMFWGYETNYHLTTDRLSVRCVDFRGRVEGTIPLATAVWTILCQGGDLEVHWSE